MNAATHPLRINLDLKRSRWNVEPCEAGAIPSVTRKDGPQGCRSQEKKTDQAPATEGVQIKPDDGEPESEIIRDCTTVR